MTAESHTTAGTCPVCGRGYILKRTVTFSTDRPAQEQFVHERDGAVEIGFYTDYCMGDVIQHE